MPGRGVKYVKIKRQVSSLGLGSRTAISLLEREREGDMAGRGSTSL